MSMTLSRILIPPLTAQESPNSSTSRLSISSQTPKHSVSSSTNRPYSRCCPSVRSRATGLIQPEPSSLNTIHSSPFPPALPQATGSHNAHPYTHPIQTKIWEMRITKYPQLLQSTIIHPLASAKALFPVVKRGTKCLKS